LNVVQKQVDIRQNLSNCFSGQSLSYQGRLYAAVMEPFRQIEGELKLRMASPPEMVTPPPF
jgi:hypothetical protein